MGKKIDLTGQRFGRLVVVKDSKKRYRSGIIWECLCDCGKTKNATLDNLKQGYTRSCGCLSIEFKKTIAKENTVPKFLKSKISKRNTSGCKGVSWDKKTSKWRATIKIQKRYIFLGRYENKQDAINVRKEAEDKYFKPILEKYSNQGVE